MASRSCHSEWLVRLATSACLSAAGLPLDRPLLQLRLRPASATARLQRPDRPACSPGPARSPWPLLDGVPTDGHGAGSGGGLLRASGGEPTAGLIAGGYRRGFAASGLLCSKGPVVCLPVLASGLLLRLP